MRSGIARACFVLTALSCTAALAAPDQPAPTHRATKVGRSFFNGWKTERTKRLNHLSVATKGMVANGTHEGNGRLSSFPTFRGSLRSAGKNYPYIMAGRDPRRGDETEIGSSLIMLSFSFDEFVDENGNNIVINSGDIVSDVIGSPNFVATRYTDGVGQFSDAVQRASFFNVMERDWHTTIDRPRLLTPVTIEVPIGQGFVFDVGGTLIAFVNFDFLFSQIQTILQLEDIRSNELVMLVSHNVFADVALGFHDAFDVTRDGKKGIQTYLWTSWIDEAALGPIFADATTITHEVSEWMADPFINNLVPEYAIPNSGDPPFCSNFLEVGDPIEFLDNQEMDITVHGKVYHTQVETLLPWFSREVPSSAFRGAYSYPDITVLTGPSQPCPPSAP